jgi:hypothetical protein
VSLAAVGPAALKSGAFSPWLPSTAFRPNQKNRRPPAAERSLRKVNFASKNWREQKTFVREPTRKKNGSVPCRSK